MPLLEGHEEPRGVHTLKGRKREVGGRVVSHWPAESAWRVGEEVVYERDAGSDPPPIPAARAPLRNSARPAGLAAV